MDSPWLEYRLSGLNLVGRPCYWILRMSVVIYRLVEWFCLLKAGNHAVSTHKHSPTALLLHFIHLWGDKLTVKRSSPFTLKTQQTLSDFIQSGVVLLTYNLFSLKCPFTEKIPIFSVKTKLRSIIIQSLHLEKETLKIGRLVRDVATQKVHRLVFNSRSSEFYIPIMLSYFKVSVNENLSNPWFLHLMKIWVDFTI